MCQGILNVCPETLQEKYVLIIVFSDDAGIELKNKVTDSKLKNVC